MAQAEENGATASKLIRVSPEMKGWLDSLRIDPRQNYDSILRNLKAVLGSRRVKKNGGTA